MNTEKNSMRLRPLGAIGTVTGSCTLLEYYCANENEKHFYLVDAGAFQNEGSEKEEVRTNVLKYYAKKIEGVFITHAHLDHIGLLPNLIRYGFRGKVYCTQATHELIITMLTDGGRFEDVKSLLEKVTFYEIDVGRGEKGAVEYGKIMIPIAYDLFLGCLRSAHILGGVSLYFHWTEIKYPKDGDILLSEKEWKWIHFSGDVGVNSEEIKANILYKDHHTPQWEKETCIVMESTYGDRSRDKENIYENKMERLEKIIDAANAKGGAIIIPAFALDRAQQVLLDLYCISRKKAKEKLSLIGKDPDWKTILKYLHGNNGCRALPTVVLTLQGKANKRIRAELAQAIERTCHESCLPFESAFSAIDEKYQDKIAAIFEQHDIPKPSLSKIQENINHQLGFTFDSPLVEKINEIYIRHLPDEVYSPTKSVRKFEYLSDDFLNEFGICTTDDFYKQKGKIKEILSRFLKPNGKNNNERIVVTSSGMCDHGKVQTLLGKYLRNEKDTLILCGFQAHGTNGYLLKNLAAGKYEENDVKETLVLKLDKDDMRLADVKCTIEDMSAYYSGHADQEQMVDYLTPSEKFKDRTERITILLNHGTEESRCALKAKIEERNPSAKVILPELDKWFDIVSHEVSEPDVESETIQESTQFAFVKIGEIQIYFPVGCDVEKREAIMNYINGL